jgi:hypothetical protein
VTCHQARAKMFEKRRIEVASVAPIVRATSSNLRW